MTAARRGRIWYRGMGKAQVPLLRVPQSSKPKLLHPWEHHPALGWYQSPVESCRWVTHTQKVRGETLRLGVLRLLLHDLQNHLAGSGAALWGGVDADGFFCSSRVLFPVHVNPASKGWMLGPGTNSVTPWLLHSFHVPMDLLELTLKCKVICTPGRREELILGSILNMDVVVRSSNHRNPNKASPSIYFKQQEWLSGGTSTCLGDGMGCPSLHVLLKSSLGDKRSQHELRGQRKEQAGGAQQACAK